MSRRDRSPWACSAVPPLGRGTAEHVERPVEQAWNRWTGESPNSPKHQAWSRSAEWNRQWNKTGTDCSTGVIREGRRGTRRATPLGTSGPDPFRRSGESECRRR